MCEWFLKEKKTENLHLYYNQLLDMRKMLFLNSFPPLKMQMGNLKDAIKVDWLSATSICLQEGQSAAVGHFGRED